jgi:hypothetical protein
MMFQKLCHWCCRRAFWLSGAFSAVLDFLTGFKLTNTALEFFGDLLLLIPS